MSRTGFLPGKYLLSWIVMPHSTPPSVARLNKRALEPVRTPPSSANCNAHLDRFHGSFNREVAVRMMFFGENHLHRSIDEFVGYYHQERNHQWLVGQIIDPPKTIGSLHGKVCRRQQIGKMLN